MPIGFFQFENLIRTRVPFLMFTWGLDFKDWFTGLEKMHVEQVLRRADQIALLLPELQKNLEQPLLFVCTNGEQSKAQMEKFESLGFKNVFYVHGGWQAMDAERASVKS